MATRTYSHSLPGGKHIFTSAGGRDKFVYTRTRDNKPPKSGGIEHDGHHYEFLERHMPKSQEKSMKLETASGDHYTVDKTGKIAFYPKGERAYYVPTLHKCVEIARGDIKSHSWFQKMSKPSQVKYLRDHPDKMGKKAAPEAVAKQHKKYAAWHEGQAKKMTKNSPAANNHHALAIHHNMAASALTPAKGKKKEAAAAIAARQNEIASNLVALGHKPAVAARTAVRITRPFH